VQLLRVRRVHGLRRRAHDGRRHQGAGGVLRRWLRQVRHLVRVWLRLQLQWLRAARQCALLRVGVRRLVRRRVRVRRWLLVRRLQQVKILERCYEPQTKVTRPCSI
jgi:hypothetical protein